MFFFFAKSNTYFLTHWNKLNTALMLVKKNYTRIIPNFFITFRRIDTKMHRFGKMTFSTERVLIV